MTAYHTCLVLKHEIEITLPYKAFDRNFKDFRYKHRLGRYFAYSVSSDGKFRCDLREKRAPEREKRAPEGDFLVRISGWKEEDNLIIRRFYCPEQLKQFDYVCDFLDLLEVWAIDHKGCFHFEYVDFDEPCMDAYCIRKGLEKEIHFTDDQLQEILDQWES